MWKRRATRRSADLCRNHLHPASKAAHTRRAPPKAEHPRTPHSTVLRMCAALSIFQLSGGRYTAKSTRYTGRVCSRNQLSTAASSMETHATTVTRLKVRLVSCATFQSADIWPTRSMFISSSCWGGAVRGGQGLRGGGRRERSGSRPRQLFCFGGGCLASCAAAVAAKCCSFRCRISCCIGLRWALYEHEHCNAACLSLQTPPPPYHRSRTAPLPAATVSLLITHPKSGRNDEQRELGQVLQHCGVAPVDVLDGDVHREVCEGWSARCGGKKCGQSPRLTRSAHAAECSAWGWVAAAAPSAHGGLLPRSARVGKGKHVPMRLFRAPGEPPEAKQRLSTLKGVEQLELPRPLSRALSRSGTHLAEQHALAGHAGAAWLLKAASKPGLF